MVAAFSRTEANGAKIAGLAAGDCRDLRRPRGDARASGPRRRLRLHAQRVHTGAGRRGGRAGKHVIVEKPLEITLRRCDTIIDACDKAGVGSARSSPRGSTTRASS